MFSVCLNISWCVGTKARRCFFISVFSSKHGRTLRRRSPPPPASLESQHSRTFTQRQHNCGFLGN